MAYSTSMATKPQSQHPLSSLSFSPIHPSNPNILLYTPPAPTSSTQSLLESPKLIILTTWLGGSTSARIAVYCRGYQTLYPSTPILLIRTVLADITTKTFATIQRQLEPARDYLLSAFPLSPSSSPPPTTNKERFKPSDGALLHIFSHGGCNSALQLSRLLHSSIPISTSPSITAPTPTFPIPLIGLILDSCPGSSSFTKAYTAATYSLPAAQPINLLGHTLLFPLIGAFSSLQALGVVSSVNDLRHELNDPGTFGLVPRLYLHSRGDEVVGVEDVASHAEEIMRKGVSVRREVWNLAAHCALPVEDAERYWREVAEFVAGAGHGQKRESRL
ncbi:hypothetical protein V494_00312 [Pseudogymnoascus sp. VKM F-4513 (FW-928)]|nr:hypothetical protein V494_00312 [Pseudogymnoascus sp. VKM F-4513 (FW-928)]